MAATFEWLAKRYIAAPVPYRGSGLRYVFDLEADSLDPTLIHCLVVADLDTEAIDQYGPTEIAAGIKHLERAEVLVGHNVCSYDLPALHKLYSWQPAPDVKVIDTLIAARLILPHIKRLDDEVAGRTKKSLGKQHGRYTLEAFGERLGIAKIGAELTDFSRWSPELQARCVADVAITKKLFHFLNPDGYSQSALALEHRAAAICERIRADGAPFDVEAAKRLEAPLRARYNELRAQFAAHFPKVNPNSHQQLIRLLAQRGWTTEKRTHKTDQPSLDREEMDAAAAVFPEFGMIPELWDLGKLLAALRTGKSSWLNHYNADDGRIHGTILPIGTPHSRAAHSKPNLAQVPNPKKGKPFGTECRALFKPPEGWVLVCCDQSNLQDRGFGHYIAPYDHGAYAESFLRGDDNHWKTADALGTIEPGTPRDKDNKTHTCIREGAKRFRYSFLYGAQDYRAGVVILGTAKDAKAVSGDDALLQKFFGGDIRPLKDKLKAIGGTARKRFIDATPGLAELQERLEKYVRKHGFVPGLDGRRVPVNSLRVALNYIITSSEAIICKRWLTNVYDELHARFKYGWDGDAVVCLWTHDEIVVACKLDIAEQVGDLMVRHAKEAGAFYNFRVPLAADFKIGPNWAGETVELPATTNETVSEPPQPSEPPPSLFTWDDIGAINAALAAEQIPPITVKPPTPSTPPKTNGAGDDKAARLEPDRKQVGAFISMMFRRCKGTHGNISLRSFPDGDRGAPPFKITRVALNGSLKPIVQAALADITLTANEAEKIVFSPPVAVFAGDRAREQDILLAPALSVELDQRPAAALAALEEVIGPATCVVASGGEWVGPDGVAEPKLHGHWRLTEPARRAVDPHNPHLPDPLADLKLARKLATKLVGGDASNVPPCHPIRWPGSWWRKGSPRLCRIVTRRSQVEIDLADALKKLKDKVPGVGQADTAAGNSGAGDGREPLDWDDAVERIVRGDEFHPTLVPLAASFAASGVPEDVAERLLHAVVASTQTQDPARRQRAAAELDKLADTVRSGYEKFAPSQAPTSAASAAAGTIVPIDLWGRFDPPELPSGLLPALIEDFAREESALMGADPAGLAMAALTVCTAVIPDSVQIKVKRYDAHWLESARLWTALVGDPSTKKTPEIMRATKRLKRLDGILVKQYMDARTRYDALSRDDRKAAEKPKQRRLRLEDTTIEAAQEVLKDSPDGVLALHDELSGWFGSMDKYAHRDSMKNRAFWLQAFHGGSYAVNRIQRGVTLIENLSISVLGGIQPDPMRRITDDTIDDGLLQRLFPIILRPGREGRDAPGTDAGHRFDDLVEDLYQRESPLEPLRFDNAAQELRADLERQHLAWIAACTVYNKKLSAHIGKYDGLFARLCLLWHRIEGGPGSIVDVATARRVADFMRRFLLPHAAAFYTDMVELSEEHERARKVAGYILAKGLMQVTNRVVQRACRTMRKLKRRDIDDVFDQLEAFGWITRVPGRRWSDPPTCYVVPAVHSRFADRAKREVVEREAIREKVAAWAKAMKG